MYIYDIIIYIYICNALYQIGYTYIYVYINCIALAIDPLLGPYIDGRARGGHLLIDSDLLAQCVCS